MAAFALLRVGSGANNGSAFPQFNHSRHRSYYVTFLNSALNEGDFEPANTTCAGKVAFKIVAPRKVNLGSCDVNLYRFWVRQRCGRTSVSPAKNSDVPSAVSRYLVATGLTVAARAVLVLFFLEAGGSSAPSSFSLEHIPWR